MREILYNNSRELIVFFPPYYMTSPAKPIILLRLLPDVRSPRDLAYASNYLT